MSAIETPLPVVFVALQACGAPMYGTATVFERWKIWTERTAVTPGRRANRGRAEAGARTWIPS